jgi:hypothetical protein
LDSARAWRYKIRYCLSACSMLQLSHTCIVCHCVLGSLTCDCVE